MKSIDEEGGSSPILVLVHVDHASAPKFRYHMRLPAHWVEKEAVGRTDVPTARIIRGLPNTKKLAIAIDDLNMEFIWESPQMIPSAPSQQVDGYQYTIH